MVKETSTMSTTTEAGEDTSGSEAKSSWLRSKIWGQPSTVSSTSIERHKAQELFRKSMQSFSLYEKSAGSSNLTNLLSIENTERNHSLEASRDNDDDVADDIAEEQDYHGETVLIQEEKHELANTTLLPNSTSVNLKDLEAESPHQPI